jgi:hypothetical protein
MAVILASLLDLAGLPQDQDDEVTQDLFNKYWNNELEDPGTSRNVKDENSCKSSSFLHNYPHRQLLTIAIPQASTSLSSSWDVSTPSVLLVCPTLAFSSSLTGHQR